MSGEGEARRNESVGRIPAAALSLEDAADEVAAGLRLRETTVFLDSIVENIPHMVFVKDAKSLTFTRINRAGEALLGVARADLLGKGDADFFPPEQAEAFRSADLEVLRQRGPVDVAEEPVDTPHGRRWLHTRKIPLFGEDGDPAFLLGISEDITVQRELRDRIRRANEELESRVAARTSELLRANLELTREIQERKLAEAALRASEDQLRQAQKLEAIGRLAGGVAHDFNNLLSVIVGYAQVMAKELDAASPMRDFVSEIHAAGLRAAGLTKQLLAFGRKQVLEPRVLDLNEVIVDVARMLERIIGEDVELRIAPSADLALARLDPTQVEQIIMNLAVNARDAMPRGGTLTLETAAVALDAAFADRHLGVTPGRFAMLRVTDTGEGMSAATQARIFEPFFTTKDSSKGTGLGLSTVFGIVQQSGGTIWVDSAPGAGSTFTLYFPVVDELDEDGTESPPHDLASLPPRGDETILVVEDDPQVRSLLANILRRQGYALLVADSAADAAARSAAHAGPIDLLLTDVIMPRTSGPRLADSLVARRPAMKVLFLSGYADDAVADQAGLAPGSAYLQKPIAVETLTRKVRELLDARASSSGLSAARGASGARRASRAPSSSRGG